MTNDLRILELRASNVKRLVAVTIRPDGDLVVIAGKNGAGKSTVLDSIFYALAGTAGHCPEPVRRGEPSAEIELDLGEFKVRRTFNAKSGATTLVVTNAEGHVQASPQRLLDAICSRVGFDPLGFSREPARKQAETLRQISGLDTSEIDARRKVLYDERTEVGRTYKTARTLVESLPPQRDVDDESSEIDVRSLLKERKAIEQRVTDAEDWKRDHEKCDQAVKRAYRVLETAQLQLEQAISDMAAVEARRVESLDDDLDAIRRVESKIVAASELNDRIRKAVSRKKAIAEMQRVEGEWAKLEKAIGQIDVDRQRMIEDARMPIDGLGFGDHGEVTFRGLPLSQASSAEQLRVSVAIGIAMHPRLKVLTIRDASLLDADSMQLVAEMAHQHGAQIWLERVGEDEAATVVIEDGEVRS